MKRILVIHGPNLNLLGKREPEVYGKMSLSQINRELERQAKRLKAAVEIFQFSHEGDIVEMLGKAEQRFSACVINPAGYTHTSVAIRDAVAACGIPVVEVHLSNIYRREEFRQKSLVAPAAAGQISGFGALSYLLGLEAAVSLAKDGQKK